MGGRDQVDEVPDPGRGLKRVPEARGAAHLVVVATADPAPVHVTRRLQVGDDQLDRPLGDAHPRRDVAQPCVRVEGEADQHMTVVAEERPAGPAHQKNST